MSLRLNKNIHAYTYSQVVLFVAFGPEVLRVVGWHNGGIVGLLHRWVG